MEDQRTSKDIENLPDADEQGMGLVRKPGTPKRIRFSPMTWLFLTIGAVVVLALFDLGRVLWRPDDLHDLRCSIHTVGYTTQELLNNELEMQERRRTTDEYAAKYGRKPEIRAGQNCFPD